MAVYFFYGEEDFNIETEIASMQSKLNPDFAAMNFITLDNPDFSTLINTLRTPPMMFGKMLCIINCEGYFASKKIKDEVSEGLSQFSDSELADIEDALKNNPDTLNIVFVVKLPRGEKKKIDSRRKLYKILTKFNVKEFQSFPTYKVAEISGWIKQRAKKKELLLENDATELLIEQFGNNLRQFDIELDKLKLLAYPNKTITKKMVSELSVSNQDLFNLTDYLMNNKKDKALLEFMKLTDKKHPLEILAALQTMLRKWILIKTKYSSGSTTELVKLTGMQDFLIRQTFQKLKNINISTLVKLKENLFNAEFNIKSGRAIDDIKEVEFAIIR